MPVERETGADESGAKPLRSFEARAYTAPLRALSIALPALAAGNILYLAAHLVLDSIEGTRSAPPLAVALGILVLSGAPWLAAALLRRALKATVTVGPSEIVVTLRKAQYQIPIASITEIRALKLPLPGPGVAFVMKSGRLFRYRLELADPGAFLSALPIPSAPSASAHPAVAFGRERALLVRRSWLFLVFKYGLFPLAFAIIFFRLHQYIVFGGPFGQYRMFGLAAYLKSFAAVWAGTLGQLFVYACVARALAEALAFSLTWAVPSRARFLRRAAEGFCYLAYFGLVPAYVAFLFLR
jgi:hypothetical protein